MSVTVTSPWGIAGAAIPLCAVIRATSSNSTKVYASPGANKNTGTLPTEMNFAALVVRRVRTSGEDWYKLSDAPNDGQVRWVRASSVEVLRGPYVAVVPAGVEEGAHPTETHSRC